MAMKRSTIDPDNSAGNNQPLMQAAGDTAARIEHILALEDALLREAEVFARHWFERRHVATETAITALREMTSCGTTDPARAMRVMTDWQSASCARVMADIQEWTTLWMRGAATTTQLDAGATGPDKAGTETGTGTAGAKAAPMSKAAQATPV